MIVRPLEFCPACGTVNPWRKRGSKVVRGERRIYVICRSCGKKDVVVYRDEKK